MLVVLGSLAASGCVDMVPPLRHHLIRRVKFFFFFSSRRRHTRYWRDWSSTCALPIFGVMVSADKILDSAIAEKADIIGLSGLITPSLDEMVHVAREMERRGFTTPMLIGGATTSKLHTAVKIAPRYSHATVHVLDASRAVGVVSTLLSDRKEAFVRERQTEYEHLREAQAKRQSETKLLSIETARSRRPSLSFSPDRPPFLGVRVLDDVPLERIEPFIDWNPSFTAWDLRGRFPQI